MHVLLMGLMLFMSSGYTADDTHRALEDSPPVIQCIVGWETGHTYNPNAVGRLGELGVAQLLPTERGGGQMEEFQYGDWVDLDPAFRHWYDPYLEIRYMEHWGETHQGTYYPWISTWSLCQ
jgi:hypothetical protein